MSEANRRAQSKDPYSPNRPPTIPGVLPTHPPEVYHPPPTLPCPSPPPVPFAFPRPNVYKGPRT
jgi:hypothetical protein